jgi:hypothetical protein
MAPGGTDERVSTEFEVWAAERVLAQHDPGSSEFSTGRCAQCPPAGPCRQLQWAQLVASSGTARAGS